MNHTPGPWHAWYFQPKSATEHLPHGMVLGPPWVSGKGYSGFEKIEDVHLVAAAPDLLEALKVCVKSMRESSDALTIDFGEELYYAKKAIARAEGKGE